MRELHNPARIDPPALRLDVLLHIRVNTKNTPPTATSKSPQMTVANAQNHLLGLET